MVTYAIRGELETPIDPADQPDFDHPRQSGRVRGRTGCWTGCWAGGCAGRWNAGRTGDREAALVRLPNQAVGLLRRESAEPPAGRPRRDRILSTGRVDQGVELIVGDRLTTVSHEDR